MNKRVLAMTAAALSLAAAQVCAGEVTVTLHEVDAEGVGGEVGHITLRDGDHGLLMMPDLDGLAPGPYAVHVHENPDCGPQRKHGHMVAAGAAGGHYDPESTGQHAGPYGAGHLGDLPVLVVESNGQARVPTLAPRPKVAQFQGRSLLIHHGADRYAEHAAHQHGKGGARMYCGVIEDD
ncbi:superoxide dismutase [Guyparkeria sp. SCN-R1]|uniref:superoxide dismutase family protein n=1 Tax=Guyparkeria sp. SCN-R1 TaxID=2341113 RepID=UPI000F65472D|nr:superoxide dismutase family protein [Guyparkeria sp. SCN-R1]RRQ24134.1 superoxide dismutase [Guyparkeria sp. SCN-R1]